MAKPIPSGIEWLTRNGVTAKAPMRNSTAGSTTLRRGLAEELVLLQLAGHQAAVSRLV